MFIGFESMQRVIHLHKRPSVHGRLSKYDLKGNIEVKCEVSPLQGDGRVTAN